VSMFIFYIKHVIRLFLKNLMFMLCCGFDKSYHSQISFIIPGSIYICSCDARAMYFKERWADIWVSVLVSASIGRISFIIIGYRYQQGITDTPDTYYIYIYIYVFMLYTILNVLYYN